MTGWKRRGSTVPSSAVLVARRNVWSARGEDHAPLAHACNKSIEGYTHRVSELRQHSPAAEQSGRSRQRRDARLVAKAARSSRSRLRVSRDHGSAIVRGREDHQLLELAVRVGVTGNPAELVLILRISFQPSSGWWIVAERGASPLRPGCADPNEACARSVGPAPIPRF